MSEPAAVAESVEEVVPGVWHWSLHDERIDFVGASHAVGSLLVDPHALAPAAFGRLPEPEAIVLTTPGHQRASWRLRRERGLPVWAPRGAETLDERPDEEYWEGDELPGGLRAIFTPGAGTLQHSLLAGRVLVTPDLLVRPPGGALAVVPAEFAHDEPRARESLAALLEVDFDVLCLGHGAPVTEDPKAALRDALGA